MASIYSRRSFVSRLGLFCSVLPLTARGQQVQPRVKRIGFLIGAFPTLITAFEQELHRLGFVDGKNLVIEKRMSRPSSNCRFLARSSTFSRSRSLDPARLACFHLCSRFSPTPKLYATDLTVCPLSIIFNALRLNSSLYLRLPPPFPLLLISLIFYPTLVSVKSGPSQIVRTTMLCSGKV